MVPLHLLLIPLVLAHLAGFAEIFGSWFLILGFLTPTGALALTGTMLVAAYRHTLNTSGFNINITPAAGCALPRHQCVWPCSSTEILGAIPYRC